MFRRKRKVEDWLSRQQEVEQSEEEETTLIPMNTWNLDYIEMAMSLERFTVSDSGAIGIASYLGSPSLSVMYPGTKKSHHRVLSNKTSKRSVIFVKILGKEYLATTCFHDNLVILWDTEDMTSRAVYTHRHTHANGERKSMNLCLVDDSTVVFGEGSTSADGILSIHTLNTGPKMWTLKRTLRLLTDIKNVWDICYVKTSNSLIMTCPSDFQVRAVDMATGEIQWRLGQSQLGKYCYPLSICLDDDNIVYVADLDQFKLHMLSGDDGNVIKSMNLYGLFITSPFCVHAHKDCIYVGHADSKMEKHRITKFTKSESITQL